MRVLQLGPYPPPEGGVSRNMLAIRDELAAGGHECTIIATTRSTEVRHDPRVLRPRSPLALIKLLRSIDYDVLHVHIGGSITRRVLAMAFACSALGRGPSVLTLHSGGYSQTREAGSARPFSIRGFIFRRIDRVIAVNERLADVLRRYGVPAERVRTIQPYTLKKPDEDVEIPATLREFYANHGPLLLAVGGLEPDYDPLFQIAAMRAVLADCPGAGLMIVGDGSMRGEVERAAASSGYGEHICLAGNTEHAVTLHLIRDADVLLRTTLFDGDAISIREALFLGTPVIATDNGMRPDGVQLIERGDADGLVELVKQTSGREKGENPAPPDDTNNIAVILAIYDELASKGNSRSGVS
jgi:glycogen synthase